VADPVPETVERIQEQRQAGTSGRTPGERAAVVAVRQVGVPYRYGGNSVKGFDCSGLVQFAYAGAGKRISRTTGDLWRQMEPVSDRDLEVGDVLFFNIEGKVSHVGLYLGSGRFVHAPATGREVTIAELDSDFYRNAFIRGGRPR
jgi:cell wall-associated NlpC family hydrolase